MRSLVVFSTIIAALLATPRAALAEERFVVVTFLSVHCPLAGLYAHRLNELQAVYADRGVKFLALDPKMEDDDAEIAMFAAKLKGGLARDEGQARATEFGITRSPEVVLLDHGRVIYRGRIDDHYTPGVFGRAAPTRRDLAIAIDEALAGKPISVPVTEPVGCRIEKAAVTATSNPVTYYGDVAAIINAKCIECHRPGEAAPFALDTYEQVAAWAGTIREVVSDKRMPPWGARGKLANDRSLSPAERDLLLAWLDAGLPAGEPVERAPPRSYGETLRADAVFTAPSFSVPAEGVLDYREVVIDPLFGKDTWIQAVEIRPGDRRVVHHVNVYLKPAGARADEVFLNELQDFYLSMAVPGNYVTRFPAGTAKMIPASWTIVLEIHYVPDGTQRADETSIALELADPTNVKRKLASRVLIDDELVIAPNSHQTVVRRWKLEDDYTLFALYPHMHLRGRSMLFEAAYPDGRREVLLDVYDYDFAWQYRYMLVEPKALPRGTVITCTALYDNTAANPHNPDPAATVAAGRKTTDEMFQAGLEICRTHENRIAGRRLWPLAALLAGAAWLWHCHRRASGLTRSSAQLVDSLSQ